MTWTDPCKVCGGETVLLFEAVVLDRHDARFARCGVCGFVAPDHPDRWLEEAYSSAINDIDIGVVSRAVQSASAIEGVILSGFTSRAKFVDYGAGYGVLVRLMRDRGYDFHWQDAYCENLFAKHFEAVAGDRYELLTAFEVFEHLVDPVAEVEAMLRYSDSLLFSTLLIADDVSPDWWYFGTEHGQHIAFYTRESLQRLADHFGLRLYTDGVQTHLLTPRRLSDRTFRFFAGQRVAPRLAVKGLRRARLRRDSLLADDFELVSGHRD